jgi:hypothetical protein
MKLWIPIIILLIIVIIWYYSLNAEYYDNTYRNFYDLASPILKESDIKTNPSLFLSYRWNEKDVLGNNIFDEIYYNVVKNRLWDNNLEDNVPDKIYDYKFSILDKKDNLSDYNNYVDPHRRTADFYGNKFTII